MTSSPSLTKGSVVPLPDRDEGHVTAPHLSDDALAESFAALHGADWRHVALWGTWYHWTGSCWQPDQTNQVMQLIREVCRVAAKGALSAADARRTASAKTMDAVSRIAAFDPRIAAEVGQWDAHPLILNTPIGQLDLITGEVSAHDRGKFLTQITKTSPGGSCPAWMRFLDDITQGDIELQAYLARFAGYCLTGLTREQVFVFLHGNGANGKSVFMRVLASVMGDYAMTATLDTFIASTGSRHLTDLAGLRAARLVMVPETEAGRGWAEARIKAITGGERVRANFMHRDHFEYLPQFKLLVAGNHRPVLSATNEAMRRRLHLVPFGAEIPVFSRNPRLVDTLLQEADGILGWMVQGCLEWQRHGLGPTAAMLAARDDYLDAEDTLGHWLEDCCQTDKKLSCPSGDLFQSWRAWADLHGHAPGTSRGLGEGLRSRGFASGKRSGKRVWSGLALIVAERALGA